VIGSFRRPGVGLALFVLAVLALVAGPGIARADHLVVEGSGGSGRCASSMEELSYEAIIEAGNRYHAGLRLRTALHNAGAVERDVVLSLALPRASELEGMAVARDGVWHDGRRTGIDGGLERRDSNLVFVRPMAPETPTGLPGAEIVAWRVPSGATIQVELRVRVHPRLRGDRWEIELPKRGGDCCGLAPERRVLVFGLRDGEEFWVDDRANGSSPFVLTRAKHSAVVTWPARTERRTGLDARYEVLPAAVGEKRGEFRLYLSLGQSPAPRPDHVVVLVDRSLSTGSYMQRDTYRVLGGLFDTLPEQATFDVLGFARSARRLVPTADEPAPGVHDPDARAALARVLDANVREQGTDITAALALAARVASTRHGRRPMILVVTDGMLPMSAEPSSVRAAFESSLSGHGARGRRRPELVFLVDEPMLATRGLGSEHAIARVAAALGARISSESLGQQRAGAALELLQSPRVLGDLDIALTRNMELETPPPSGLVAGNFLVLRGTYHGRPASRATVRGRLGHRRVRRQARVHVQSAPVEALVADLRGGVELVPDAETSFVYPPWYSQHDRHDARRGIARAGLGGYMPKGRLSRSIFGYYLRTRVLPRARVCYNHAVARSHTQGGRVTMDIEVGKGEVMAVRMSTVELGEPDSKLVACLNEAAWALDIPAGKLDDRTYRLRYPLRLVPPEGGGAARVGDPLGEGTVELLLDIAPTGG
jgi:hypothetical protein